MNYKNGMLILFIVLIASMSMGCLESPISISSHEVGTEYEIYSIDFHSNHEDATVLCFVNNTFTERYIYLVDYEGQKSSMRYNGVLIVDNKSYFKLSSIQTPPVKWFGISMGNSTPKYYYEVHVTKDDLNKYLN